jgi:outer membrane protein OmpA-like peptidoglycan-associated protein
MKTSDKPILRGSILSPAMLVLAVGLAGCGGPIVFSGQSPMTIGGDLPPPPPPPPPPPKVEAPKPPPRVELKEDKIQINEKVQFEYNASKIKPESFGLLQDVAKVIKEHPSLKKIMIEGHASSEGNDQYNMKLSDERAKAVRDYLIKEGGVAADRLEAKGFGETKPIATNDTEQGREQNRRVEFNIVQQDSAARKAESAAAAGAAASAAQAEAKKEAAAKADEKKDKAAPAAPAAEPKKK